MGAASLPMGTEAVTRARTVVVAVAAVTTAKTATTGAGVTRAAAVVVTTGRTVKAAGTAAEVTRAVVAVVTTARTVANIVAAPAVRPTEALPTAPSGMKGMTAGM